MEFLSATLDNGLQIIAETNTDVHSMAAGFFVKTGARDESPELAGVSHFLEHMVFKGTPGRSAEQVNRAFDDMGSSANAFTGEESTVYYATVLPEFQDHVVNLLGDILRPSLREDDFETEKKVIIEEIQMYLDQPPFGADDVCRRLFYGDHPLSHSVLGTEASVGGMSAAGMRGYFQQRYSPANIVLAAAGRVDFDALVKSAQKYCGSWERFEAPRNITKPATTPGFDVIQRKTSTQAYSLQMANGPGATDPDRFAAKLLATVLGDDSGSRLYWKLVDPGLADNATLGHHDHHGAGLFFSYLSCEPEMIEENLRTMHEVYREASETGITAAELSQAKNKIASRLVLGSERPRGRLFNIGSNWTYRGEYRSVKKDLDAVEAVTVEQANAVLAKYPLTRNATVVVGPLAEVKAPG